MNVLVSYVVLLTPQAPRRLAALTLIGLGDVSLATLHVVCDWTEGATMSASSLSLSSFVNASSPPSPHVVC